MSILLHSRDLGSDSSTHTLAHLPSTFDQTIGIAFWDSKDHVRRRQSNKIMVFRLPATWQFQKTYHIFARTIDEANISKTGQGSIPNISNKGIRNCPSFSIAEISGLTHPHTQRNIPFSLPRLQRIDFVMALRQYGMVI